MNNLFKTDCHTHILPGIDDGSSSLQESAEMLRMLLAQGVGTIFATSHYYSHQESVTTFLKKRQPAFLKLLPLAEEMGVTLLPGSETYLSDSLFVNDDISGLCIGQSNYILTELSFSSGFRQSTISRLEKLMNTYSVVPILAHVERYPNLFNDKKKMEEIVDMGCLLQTNLGALTAAGFFVKQKTLRYISDGLIHLVGTDAHNTTSRPPLYEDGIRLIERKLGRTAAMQLQENAQDIIAEA